MATIKGKWKFKDKPNTFYNITQSVNFTSNGVNYTSMETFVMNTDPQPSGINYNTTEAFSIQGYVENSASWSNEAYKDIDFGSTNQTVDDGFYTWFTTNTTQIIETSPTKIKSPCVVIQNKVKQVVIDNANMTIDIYTKEVPAAMATVTITNTATTGINAKVYKSTAPDQSFAYINADSSITLELEVGSIICIDADYETSPSYMAAWKHTSLTGDIVLSNDFVYGQGYIINGDGTITGYAYDSD